ncbi:MAG: hypothetical protein ACK476_00595 [Fluviicola sp.]|jgi:hypothetical protein
MNYSRLLKNWNLSRILFLFLGISILYQTTQSNEWFGYIIGVYFLLMGVFALGCASGNCGIPHSTNTRVSNSENDETIHFEEVQDLKN